LEIFWVSEREIWLVCQLRGSLRVDARVLAVFKLLRYGVVVDDSKGVQGADVVVEQPKSVVTILWSGRDALTPEPTA
jgi:hypothetical protein